jgi:nicotinamide-nucleotide amidase
MSPRQNATAEIVAIGDELLHGRIVDTNSPTISRALEEAGLRMHAVSVVGDDLDDACRTLEVACRRSDVVVVTGGLGPTADDRTREAVARVAGVPLELDPESWRQIDAFIRSRGRVPSESNRVQAEFPRGARPLENRWGTAPGFEIEIGRGRLFALPGVPSEMQAMLGHHVVPRVLAVSGGAAIAIHELHLIGATEAAIGERIARYLADGHRPRVGINAHYATYTVRVAAEAGSEAAARAEAERVAAELRSALGELVVYEGDEAVHERVLRLAERGGLTLALAESCTGGLLGARLTEVPGSSAVLKAGYVAYEDAAKTRDLGVPERVLAEHGAVSVEVAAAMAEGAMRRAGTTLGIAITGVAGPGGGSAEKPVGTVCFGLARAGSATESWRKRIGSLGRRFVREHAVLEALFALVRRL